MCEKARLYYYDYLCGESQNDIPEEILAHINQCHFCQAELDRLKIILAKTEEPATDSTSQTTSVITTNIRLHFAYTGTLVTCKMVRPFLPSLADPALEIGIPTPITVHLDKCQQCTNDLETIRQLNLTHKQLCRLGRLFAEKPAENAVSCSQVQTAVTSVGSVAFHETNAEVLKHLCTCPNCRELLYKYRQAIHELQDQRIQQKFPCEEVSATDIFDYCFSYGINPANGQYAKFHSDFTSHVRTCPKCTAKMQGLHRTLYSILERQESGIVTHFKLRNTAQNPIANSPNDVYMDWPIEIKVLDKSKLEPDIITFPQKIKQRSLATTLRKFRIPAVAAIILITFGLFFLGTPVAKAIDLGHVYKALEQIKNVYLATFIPEDAKPIQEIWLSRALNIKMFKTNTQYVLWDIKGKSKKVKELNAGSFTTTKLSKNILAKVERTMEIPWGLLPFNDVSQLPKQAQWQQMADETVENTIANTHIYDLMWVENRLSSSMVYRKWRGYIDTETKLPKRIEHWEKYSGEEEYELISVIELAYPSTLEIQTVISNIGL
jgi:hypothetical protein